MKYISSICFGMLLLLGVVQMTSAINPSSDLRFRQLAKSWDEGIPLGNATVGALVWQKGESLRLSLDRTDLWDLRPTDSLSGANNRFSWVKDHIRKNDYLPVQKKFDWPYDNNPAPSKIPGAALEFALQSFGEPEEVCLSLNKAVCTVKWKNGVSLKTFVQANSPIGWFIFRNLKEDIVPSLQPPSYNQGSEDEASPVTGQDLRRLGYKQGQVIKGVNYQLYHQQGFGTFYYDVAVAWKRKGKTLLGAWSVTSSMVSEKALVLVRKALVRGIEKDRSTHIDYWKKYWKQSSVTLPDTLLQKQYDNEMYKFGSATREHSYPISLQAVWTADNGKLPPWKGDYHHDLNTQLSYWPAYTGNHLKEGLGYLNTLFSQRKTYKKYTKQYFETEGMNVPGVCTLTGEPMGGWIQYSMSQTCGAWLAQHFYLHWKYSADQLFLKQKAYPFVKDVAIYLEQQSRVDEHGERTLEFSSSPEIFDNSVEAWFKTMTNYDLSLMKFLFKAATEMANALNLKDEAQHWMTIQKQLPSYSLDDTGALAFAKGFPYQASHRHFSHALAIHPLGLINWDDSEQSRQIIRATLNAMDKYGSDWWTGYTFAWLGSMKARAYDGDGAYKALRTFASCFCLSNTFHVNGDQSGTNQSKFTYRPFTLEGNFAFAAGVQEMLLQSHTGVIKVFPAIPSHWENVSFENLRAEGAFLISAERINGKVVRLNIKSEKGLPLRVLSPVTGQVIDVKTKPGEVVTLI